MANPFFKFKQFTIYHDRCAMKVSTDSCLFGAWVAHELKHQSSPPSNILDVGSGSGLLSLQIAQKIVSPIDGIEIDSDAAVQSQENIAASPWKDNITIINEDVLQWKTEKKYDCIVSNPPFYERELHSPAAKKNVAHHSDGLLLKPLLTFIKTHLSPGGTFFLLLPYKRADELDKYLQPEKLGVQKKIYVRQTFAHEPFRVMIKGTADSTSPDKGMMAIKDVDSQYTKEFTNLLKDYYLYL